MTTNFFHPSLLLLFLDPGSGIRDPGSAMGKNQDPGSEINIPDPPHCRNVFIVHSSMLSCHSSSSCCSSSPPPPLSSSISFSSSSPNLMVTAPSYTRTVSYKTGVVGGGWKQNKTCFRYIYGPMIRPRGQIHYEGKWEGVGPWKSRLFWVL